MDTPIDKFHDYTHTEEFTKATSNEDFRYILRELGDLSQRLQNIASHGLPNGVYFFDVADLESHIGTLIATLKAMRRVK